MLASKWAIATFGQSTKDDWETPQPFFDELDAEFGFTWDVCAHPWNAKCVDFFTPEQDAFNFPWHGVCWMNPPYGRGISDWMFKAFHEAQEGATVVCLVPARTDTGWWHDYAMRGEIRFIRGRLRFSGSKINAPFPSAVVIFRPATEQEQPDAN